MPEIELKFQVPAARLPALERALATQTAERLVLRAVYFDTADARLEAAQMVLRVRSEGGRWVQALKGRGDGLMQRLEHEVPLPPAADPPAPDPALHAGTDAGRALATLLAGVPLQPVHGTEIHRLRRVLRHGGTRVEVALDLGAVLAGDRRAPVCELELEWLSGPLSGLLDLADRWVQRFGLVLDPTTKSERAQWLRQGLGAPPVVRAQDPALAAGADLATARAAMLAASLAQALPNAAALAAGTGGPDHVHQLRVALRRLRSVLRALGPADEARDAALRQLFAALGGRRDSDVLELTLAPAWAAAAAAGLAPPAADAPVPVDDLGPVLRSATTTRLWLALLALTLPTDDAEGPWGPPLRDRIRRWRRAARRQAARWATLDDAGRHALRKRLKRLRYLTEFAQPVLPPRRTRADLTLLRALQEALGHWNDLVVARAALAPDAHTTPARAFAAGWLAREAQAADAACAEAAAAFSAGRRRKRR